jgi:hypothetical protein
MLVCFPKWRWGDIRKCILGKSVMKGELIGFGCSESDTSKARGVINHKLYICHRHD